MNRLANIARCGFLVFVVEAGRMSAGAGTDPDGVMAALVEGALADSPQVTAARHRVARAAAGVGAQQGFFDPRAAAVAGWSREGRAVPGVTRGEAPPSDSTGVHAGIEMPVRPGFHVGVGAAERRLSDLDVYESLYQTEAGVQVAVPLRRDRGFAQWRAAVSQAEAELAEAEAGLLRVCQDTRRDVEDRYLLLQQALAAYDIARAATERAERLLDEARQLLDLSLLPAYQMHAPRLEAARRRDEEAAALSLREIRRRQLGELVGMEAAAAVPVAAVDLPAWAAGVTLPDVGPAADAPARRGAYREVGAQWAAEHARWRAAEDADLSDLSVRAAYTWRGEDETRLIGTGARLADTQSGAEVAVVWSCPLGGRTAAGRIAASKARLSELRELGRQVGRQVALECDVAAAEFRSAETRLKLATAAVEDARAALAAEEERFRLGEGGSRQVLDAQQDLTDAIRRQYDIVTALLRARTACVHAAGLGIADAAGRQEEKRP